MRGRDRAAFPRPAAGLGLLWRDAAACESQQLSTFQSVLVLWNVADVEGKRTLASFGGPCIMGMGRGGAGDTCAASGLELTLSWLFTGNFVRVPLPCAHRKPSEATSLLAKKLYLSY